MKRLRLAMLAGFAWLAAPAAQAHHSFAAFFESEKIITVTGKVTEFRFTNPHGTITVEGRSNDGRIALWRAETNAPVVLMRRGWKRDSIKPGDNVTLTGWPSRDGKPYLRLQRAVDANGKMIGSAPFNVDESRD
ncbi:MAG TPA: DUF6152 family protein [Sphingomonadaceae bacterium]|nr:DUF6152 family protein [Sphingomonadaceae bacterium]